MDKIGLDIKFKKRDEGEYFLRCEVGSSIGPETVDLVFCNEKGKDIILEVETELWQVLPITSATKIVVENKVGTLIL